MVDIINIYNSILINKFKYIMDNSIIKKKEEEICKICKEKFNELFIFEKSIKFSKLEFHQLIIHFQIDYFLYEKICKIKLEQFDFDFQLIHSNNINIIDGLYEEGSYNIFTDKNKNLFNTNILRFSEHSGFIIFNNNIVDKIIVLNDYRTDEEDPTIFLPKNNIEALSVDYIFHTHPKSPELGSRLEYKLLYEFPSISDIYHFIDHHNRGILKGSLVITPEGLYIIRKYNFNNNKIIIDEDIFNNDIEEVYLDCYEDSYVKYKTLKINENNFYKYISNNFEYIYRINKILEKYDLAIDFISRVKSKKIFKDYKSKWIIPNIFIPII